MLDFGLVNRGISNDKLIVEIPGNYLPGQKPVDNCKVICVKQYGNLLTIKWLCQYSVIIRAI